MKVHSLKKGFKSRGTQAESGFFRGWPWGYSFFVYKKLEKDPHKNASLWLTSLIKQKNKLKAS
jgi:hypothetical protein